MSKEKKDRREFLGVTGVAAASGILSAKAGVQTPPPTDGAEDCRFEVALLALQDQTMVKLGSWNIGPTDCS